MGQIVVRRLDDAVKERLKARAKARGVSMEEEARTILEKAVAGEAARKGVGELVREILDRHGVSFEENELPRFPSEPMQIRKFDE